jgi:hypothetical protein
MSATIDGKVNIGLPLDHFRLNKFSTPGDGNYQDICGEIVRFYREAKRKIEKDVSTSSAPDFEDNTAYTSTDRYQSIETLATPGKLKQSMQPRLQPHPGSSSGLNVDFKVWASSQPSNKLPRTVPAGSSTRNEEEHLRKIAIEELKQEEATKEAAAKKEELDKMYQERVDSEQKQKKSEMAAAKEAAERQYLDRLRANMKKYGVLDTEKILNSDPLPKDKDLSEQEIKEKDRWYKNRVKAALSEYGLPDGQIDEILNDTGDTMIIDGVRTTYTRMALKWLRKTTLDRYKVPYQIDKVSEYEMETG